MFGIWPLYVDVDRVGRAVQVLDREADAVVVAGDGAVEDAAADLDVLAVVVAGDELGDLQVVGALRCS